MANYKCACVCDLPASLGTSMLKIKHGGRTIAVQRSARRTRGRYTKDMQYCNITRAKRQGQTCICYSTRKVNHLQVFYGGKQIGKQRTLQRTLKHVLSLLKKIHLAEASPFSMKDWTKRVLKRRTVITGPSISQWNSFVKRTKVQS